MSIHPIYIHALSDVQVRPMHRLPIVGVREPIDGGALATWCALVLILCALAAGAWLR